METKILVESWEYKDKSYPEVIASIDELINNYINENNINILDIRLISYINGANLRVREALILF